MILKYFFWPGASSASSLLSKAYLSKQVGYEPETKERDLTFKSSDTWDVKKAGENLVRAKSKIRSIMFKPYFQIVCVNILQELNQT